MRPNTLSKRIERVEKSLSFSARQAVPEGMIKIAYDSGRFWWPEDHKEYEELFSQWSDLEFKNRSDLQAAECLERDRQAGLIRSEMDHILARQIKNTTAEAAVRRAVDDRLEREIISRIITA